MAHPSIVFACQFHPDGRAEVLPDPSRWEGPPSQLWLHLDYSVPGADEFMRSVGLGEHTASALCEVDTRPRVMSMEGGTLITLRAVNLNPGADPEDMVSIRFFLEPHRMISVRQRRLLSVTDVRTEVEAGTGPTSIDEAFAKVLHRIGDRIDEVADRIDATVTEHESRESTNPLAMRAEIAAARRQTAAIRRFLAPQRDALNQLAREHPDALDREVQFDVREEADRITRVVEDLDLVRERALVLQEEYLAEMQQQQNSRMYLLSMVAVIFLPLTFITGVFGMNVAGLPGLEDGLAFLWVCLGMIASTGLVIGVLRLLRWF